MRGKADCQRGKELPFGITPAHAGKRMVIWLLLMVSRGSPPRMRGKDQMFAAPRPLIGITPAHAGKSDTCPIRSGDSRDHPRACGEKHCGGVLHCSGMGSPPRMRGKVACPAFTAGEVGITPAHAGKSDKIHDKKPVTRDHPRACGEKVCALGLWLLGRGSPPRMRGKDRRTMITLSLVRITPAHAGKRKTASRRGLPSVDHPRACGEKYGWLTTGQGEMGSPPRMRGSKALAGLGFQHLDHPRACGEKTKKIPYYRLFPLRSAPFSFSFA